MNRVPHVVHIKITGKHWDDASALLPHYPQSHICNKAIEIALAEQHQADAEKDLANAEAELNDYITAEEARKLEVGNAEYSLDGDDWYVCDFGCEYAKFGIFSKNEYRYRAIKQEPLASLPDQLIDPEAKKELGEWIDSQQPEPVNPLKQVSWKDVPAGVAVMAKTDRSRFWLYHGYSKAMRPALSNLGSDTCDAVYDYFNYIELAPASEQNFIAVQANQNGKLIKHDLERAGFVVALHESDEKYRITGLAEGWVLG